MDLKEEEILGPDIERHWYYRAKAKALARVVDARGAAVLDVGAGSGFFSRALLERGAAEATLVDPGYPADRDETHAGRPLRFRRAADASGASLILMMDVLEHVEDDAGLARQYVASARPGTRLVATVPAFQWLWSGHDVFLEHHRRYTLKQLSHVLENAGVSVTGGRYLYGLLLPLAAASRLAPGSREPRSQMRRFGPAANALFSLVCDLEAAAPGNRLAGLTAMAWGTVR
jgi:hypothetical protein